MISAQDQARLIQVGPGTECGEWLRAFWFPIAISDRWDGERGQLALDEPMTFKGRSGTAMSFGAEHGTFRGKPTAVRILGEDLVLYRDGGGTLGLVGIKCPHRSSSLEYGRVRDRGLSCQYHGWTFDETGRCLAMPGEPRDSTFKDKVRHTAYPVRELGGLIWTYMGRREAPILPQLDVIAREDGLRVVENFCLWPANWLQIVENSVDQIHTGILHGEDSSRADVWSEIPAVDWIADDHGIQTHQTRGSYRRTNYLRLPNTILLTQPWPGGKFSWPRYSAIFRTPVDDNHTLLFHVTIVLRVNGKLPELPAGMRFAVAPQVHTIFLQDYRAIVSQGSPVDRTAERLATTDRGVIMLRKMILEGIDAVRRGEDAPGVLRGALWQRLLESSERVTDGLMRTQAAEYGRRSVTLLADALRRGRGSLRRGGRILSGVLLRRVAAAGRQIDGPARGRPDHVDGRPHDAAGQLDPGRDDARRRADSINGAATGQRQQNGDGEQPTHAASIARPALRSG